MSLRTHALTLFLLASANATALASCAPVGCTLIGCFDQIEIDVRDGSTGASITAFSGTLVVNGTVIAVACSSPGNATAVYRCPTGSGGLIVLNTTAETIRVTLTAASSGKSLDADVPVSTQVVQPNGPACPPTCRQGHATAALM